MLFMIFVFLIGFALVAVAIARLSGGNGGDDPGGGGPWWRRGRGPRPRGPRPRGPEPTWWPEFEREFRAYARAQGTDRPATGISR
jgi:hypothetical protein